MVHTAVVGVEHGFEQLKQHDFGRTGTALEHALVNNGREKVVGAVLQDNVHTVGGLPHLMQREDVRVDLDVVVQGDFSVQMRGPGVERG